MLAEKLETVLFHNIANTRPRDYYDVHILYALRCAECDKATLRRALKRTTQKSGGGMILTDYPEIMKESCFTAIHLALYLVIGIAMSNSTRAIVSSNIAIPVTP